MGCALQEPLLRQEQDNLHRVLYDVPSLVDAPPGRGWKPPPAGCDAIGDCTIRMLLTALSHWRGARAILHPTGVWPRLLELPSGPRFLLGPIPSAQHQLLTDAQLIRLLCVGCPFARPKARVASDFLNSVELDRHDSAARMRAILCASIFFEWREGEYLRQRQPAADTAALRPGAGCRRAHTRASMGQLIAGLNVRMFRQDLSHEQGTDHEVVYGPAAIPLGGFPMAALPEEQGPPSPPGMGRAGGSPATPFARDNPAPRGARTAPAADGGGGEDGSRDLRRILGQADAQPRPRFIPRSNPRVRSCLERETARDENVRRSEWWREAPAAKPLGVWHA
jgi:hypothetical protein